MLISEMFNAGGLKRALPYALIVLACIACYANTFDVPFLFDDTTYIIDNPTIRNIAYFVDPLQIDGSGASSSVRHYFTTRYMGYLSFFLNYKLGGLNVFGYHVVNLAIHALNALLVYVLLLLTFRTPLMKGSILAKNTTGVSLLAALLFAVHPLQTQSVTYITQRFASLAALFYLLSLVLYVKWRLDKKEATGVFAGKRALLYLGCLVSAVFAMKTKETAFTLPVAVLLYEFMFFTGEMKKRLISLLPLALTMLIVPFSVMDLRMPIGNALEGATRTQIEISRGAYLVTQFRVLVTYLRLLLLPANQTLDYDYPLYDTLLSPQVLLSFLFLVLIVASLAFFLVRFRRGGGAWMGIVAFGGLWFFLTLSVESSFIPLADVIFEHRLYLPSVGVFAAVGAGAFSFSGGFRSKRLQVALVAVLTSILLLLSAATYSRNEVWKDETSLWKDVTEKAPLKARGHNSLGLSYWIDGQETKAIEQYTTALELDPEYPKAYNNRGAAYSQLKQYGKALHDFDKAIELKPDYYEAYNNRGVVFHELRQYNSALMDFESAIRFDPDYSEAYNNRGVIHRDLKQYEKALKDFNRAIELNPNYADPYSNRGLTYWDLKEYDRVIEDYNRAIELNPNFAEAYYNRGLAYSELKEYKKALSNYNKALELDPDHANASNNRGFTYMTVYGDVGKACEDWKNACELGVCENYNLAKSRGICD